MNKLKRGPIVNLRRTAWFILGFVALGLGILGAMLPLLPTTPFVLVAAFAFARSSDRWHNWLLSHRIFGPLIANWRTHGALNRTTKIVSILSMVAVFALSLAMRASSVVLIVQTIVLGASAVFILTRPAPPKPA